MEKLISQLLESALCLGVFYGFYRLALRRETCFAPTRWYLLASIPVSLVIPMLNIPGPWQSPQTAELWMETLSGVQVVDLTNGGTALQSTLTPLAWTLIIAYALGLGFFASRLIHQLALMRRLIQKSESASLMWQGIPVIFTEGQLPTFAFGKYLFFDNTLPLNEQERDQVLHHEAVHIRQRHTLDVILMEVFQVVLWFNPLVHLVKRGLSETHEYLADAEVVRSANAMAYGKLLAKQVLYQMDLTLGSYFNRAQVFKRLEMLKLKTYESSARRFRLLIPLTAIMLGVFSCEKTDAWMDDLPELMDQPTQELGRLDIFILQDDEGFSTENEFVEIHNTSMRARVGDLSVVIEGIENEVDRKRALEFLADLRKEVEVTAPPIEEAPDENSNGLDQQPHIRGGKSAMGEIMGTQMHYPSSAREARLEGRVYVSFLLTKEGTVENPMIARSPEANTAAQKAALKELEAEALRGVVATSGYWEPAIKEGKPVDIKVVVPVTFSL